MIERTVELKCRRCGESIPFQMGPHAVLDLRDKRMTNIGLRLMAGETPALPCTKCREEFGAPAPIAIVHPAKLSIIFLIPPAPFLNNASANIAMTALGHALAETIQDPPKDFIICHSGDEVASAFFQATQRAFAEIVDEVESTQDSIADSKPGSGSAFWQLPFWDDVLPEDQDDPVARDIIFIFGGLVPKSIQAKAINAADEVSRDNSVVNIVLALIVGAIEKEYPVITTWNPLTLAERIESIAAKSPPFNQVMLRTLHKDSKFREVINNGIKQHGPTIEHDMIRGAIIEVAAVVTREAFGIEPSIVCLEKITTNTEFYDISSDQKTFIFSLLSRYLRARHGLTHRSKDLQHATEFSRMAVATYSPPTEIDWDRFSLSGNLANSLVYSYRFTGRIGQLEEAIELIETAILQAKQIAQTTPTRLRNHFRDIINRAKHALASALDYRFYRTRLRFDLERAIAIQAEVLNDTPVGHEDLNTARLLLVSLLKERYVLDGEQSDVAKCLTLVQAVLETEDGKDVDLVYAYSLKGTVLEHKYNQEHTSEDVMLSIAAHTRALEMARQFWPAKVQEQLLNLGRAKRLAFETDQNVEYLLQSRALLEQSLQLARTSDSRLPVLSVLMNTVWALLINSPDTILLRQFEASIRRCLQELDDVFLLSPVNYQIGQQSRWIEIYGHIISAHWEMVQMGLLKMEWRRDAMALAESSKSRLLSTIVGRQETPAPPEIPNQLLEKEGLLLDEIAAIDMIDLANYGATMQKANKYSERQDLQAELHTLWREMEQYGDRAAVYVHIRRCDGVVWEDITRIASGFGSDTAFISLYLVQQVAMFMFVYRDGWPSPEVQTIDVDLWTRCYRTFGREMRQGSRLNSVRVNWHKELLPILAKVQHLVADCSSVIILPTAESIQLPWCALLYEAGWTAQTVVTPTLGLLERACSPTRSGQPVVVGDPALDPSRTNGLRNLPAAVAEAHAVAKLVSVDPLIGTLATKVRVLEALGNAPLAHFAAHAVFKVGEPLDSGIELTDGRLTAREILASGLITPPTCILSACQSGLSEALGGEELAGLGLAFFYAGTETLIVSLWHVNDEATTFLMNEFYQAWKNQGLPQPVALRVAMEATKSARPEWQNVYYWGGFNILGKII